MHFQYISNILKEKRYLEHLQSRFANEHKLTPMIGVELEFYLSQHIAIAGLSKLIAMPIIKEEGKNQFELNFPPTTNLIKLVHQVNATKQQIMYYAKLYKGVADFSPKPFLDDYGNGMHINLSFVENNDEEFVHACAKTLCYFLTQTLLLFMESENEYSRLDYKFMAPTHIAYGKNNRSVAIRINTNLPQTVIEHRVPSASSNIYSVLCAILRAIEKMILEPHHDIHKFFPIYGNAFDEQYQNQPIPSNHQEALEHFNINFFDFNKYFQL
ncbi:Glutamine synthetase [Rickettsiales endosymbiont of Paramecium tredecaurelia]|nr:Glutamine synthetase [Candidatus Sarmatiella mevalonica]